MVVRSQGAISGAGILIHLIVGIVVWSTAGNRMVVEHTGFRSRWSGNSSAAAVSELQHVDNTTSDVAGGWELVELPDAEDLSADLEDASAEISVHQDFVPSQEMVFMNPKFKSVATKPSSLSDQSLFFKLTAYEVALRHVDKMIADLKQPWQREPLASSVTRPKHFWERFQVSQKLHLAGLSDHVTAFTSDSVVHMQIQQTELTVQHIIPSCVVSSCDNFQHVGLARFEMMVLLDLDAHGLGSL